VLISAVGSGVGTAAVQLARVLGARALGNARTPTKLESAETLGLTRGDGIVPDDGAFAKQVLERTGGAGADVIIELVGGAYVAEDVACIAEKGRIVLGGLTAGASAELDLRTLLRKRATLRGTVLRARPLEEKIAAMRVFAKHVVPFFASGALKAVVDRVFPLAEAAAAHTHVAGNESFGKVVLEID